MFKQSVFLGATSGILSGIASVIYAHFYNDAMGTDFSKIINPVGMVSICIAASFVWAIGFTLFTKWFKTRGEIIFNFVFVILTFASIIGPFSVNLPLDIHSPELFPGLAIPMHFFPALGWFTLKPLFIKSTTIPQSSS
jgi:hypothetical protein